VSEDRLRRHFGKVHAQHVAALTRHLIACREICDGDLDLFLVLTIIGERTFTARDAPADMSHQDFLDRTVDTLQPAAINLQSIADYSGIPRETVRRKLRILQDKGWIAKDERNFMTVTDKAKANLNELTDSSLKYLVDIDTALDQLD
jgi:predicted transcriptional regulator